jgi:hypothetical protein
MAVCVEAHPEGTQVIAVAAWPLTDGRVRFDVLEVWASTEEARSAMIALKSAHRPRLIGWFPKGPGASLSARMRKLGAKEIKGQAEAEACMTLADHIDGRRVIHPDHPILNDHVRHTGTAGSTKVWTFDRGPGATHATWAMAGALYLALNMERPTRRNRRILVADVPD